MTDDSLYSSLSDTQNAPLYATGRNRVWNSRSEASGSRSANFVGCYHFASCCSAAKWYAEAPTPALGRPH